MSNGKLLFLSLLLFLVGASGGFFYRDARDAAVVEMGWCCMTAGQPCVKSPDMDTCAAAGGQLFDVSPSACAAVCGASS